MIESPGAEALIRDLARLILKYSASEWQEVIALFRGAESEHARILRLIEQLRETAPERAARGSVKAKLSFLPDDIPTERAEVLNELVKAMRAKRVLTSIGRLRAVYTKAGGKEALPAKRDAAVRPLVRVLALLPDPEFQAVLRDIWTHETAIAKSEADLSREYMRWFAMIYPGSEDRGP